MLWNLFQALHKPRGGMCRPPDICGLTVKKKNEVIRIIAETILFMPFYTLTTEKIFNDYIATDCIKRYLPKSTFHAKKRLHKQSAGRCKRNKTWPML